MSPPHSRRGVGRFFVSMTNQRRAPKCQQFPPILERMGKSSAIFLMRQG